MVCLNIFFLVDQEEISVIQGREATLLRHSSWLVSKFNKLWLIDI